MRAIDVHVHPSTRGLDCDAIVYFGRDLNNLPRTEETLSAFFTKQNVKGLLIAWHPSTVMEAPRLINEYVIDLVSKYPDAFAGVLAGLNKDITGLSTFV